MPGPIVYPNAIDRLPGSDRRPLTYTLVEPCCGSAAFTLHLLGARRFGAVKPMIPSLIRALRGYDRALIEVDVDARCEGAAAPGEIDARTLVYLDPPYVESTRYPDGQMTRRQVEALAQAWAARGGGGDLRAARPRFARLEAAAPVVWARRHLTLPGQAARVGHLPRGRSRATPGTAITICRVGYAV